MLPHRTIPKAMAVDIDISVREPRWHSIDGSEATIDAAVAATLAHLGMADLDVELSVLLTSDDDMAGINGQWRGKPVPTNVLSFAATDIRPGQRPGPLLGDLVLACQTIEREASQQAKALHSHLFHLCVHSTLHLLGFDHDVDSRAEIMERHEKDILAAHGISDPYIMPDE